MSLVSFDYGQLDRPLQAALRHSANRLKELVQKTGTDLWEMGRILADMQERLAAYGTGTFLQWVETEAGLTKSTCYRLMNVYRAFDFPNLEQMNLGPSVLYKLSEPSAPVKARDEIIRRAVQGEKITLQKVQRIVDRYSPPKPPKPPLPERPPLPEPSTEYTVFERDELLPLLRDAGLADAPQMLTGARGDIQPVPEKEKEQAWQSLRADIIAIVRKTDKNDDESLCACADEILEALGQSSGSISIAARFGIELSKGPLALADLTSLAIQTAGEDQNEMDRDTYLVWRKRVLRLVDSLTFGNCCIYEHTLDNAQLVYSLLPQYSADA